MDDLILGGTSELKCHKAGVKSAVQDKRPGNTSLLSRSPRCIDWSYLDWTTLIHSASPAAFQDARLQAG